MTRSRPVRSGGRWARSPSSRYRPASQCTPMMSSTRPPVAVSARCQKLTQRRAAGGHRDVAPAQFVRAAGCSVRPAARRRIVGLVCNAITASSGSSPTPGNSHSGNAPRRPATSARSSPTHDSGGASGCAGSRPLMVVQHANAGGAVGRRRVEGCDHPAGQRGRGRPRRHGGSGSASAAVEPADGGQLVLVARRRLIQASLELGERVAQVRLLLGPAGNRTGRDQYQAST